MCARAPRFICDQRFNYDASVYKILELFLSCKAFFFFCGDQLRTVNMKRGLYIATGALAFVSCLHRSSCVLLLLSRICFDFKYQQVF